MQEAKTKDYHSTTGLSKVEQYKWVLKGAPGELMRKPAPIQPPPWPFWYPPMVTPTPVQWPTQPIITCEVKT